MRAAVLRWSVAFVVAIALIAQAAAVVRHNGYVIDRALASAESRGGGFGSAMAALEADLKLAICHPGSAATADQPGSAPVGSGGDCPICNGLASAIILAPSSTSLLPTHGKVTLASWFPVDQRSTDLRLVRLRSRGPPVSV